MSGYYEEYYEEDAGMYEPVYEVASPTEFYDCDAGVKTSLAKRVQESPIRYSILRSATIRFKEDIPQAPAVDYNIDTAHKKNLERAVEDSTVKYAAVFSKSSRFQKDLISEAPDKTYDTDNLRFSTLSKAMNDSPIKYANVRSNANRFAPTGVTDAPDVWYETDQGMVKTLSRSMKESPVRYSVMKSKAGRFKKDYSTTSELLGPGTYDPPPMSDVRYDQTARELSSFKSSVPRLNVKRDPTKYLGSTYHQEHDTKAWSHKSFKISDTKLTRPQYLPQAS